MDLQRAAKSLSLHAERGARVRELESVGLRGFRQLRKHGFRLVYKSDQKSVIVLAVVHEKRDIATALMSRVKQDPT
jgi:plasmid stabilization system protein ParE